MSLANLVEPGVEVSIPGSVSKKVRVFPLVLEDIGLLLRDYSKELDGLLSGTMEVQDIVQSAPTLVAAIIAHGTRNPEEIDLARRLPFGTQVRLASEIWRLTAVDPAELGKVLSGMLEGLLAAARNIDLKQMERLRDGQKPSRDTLNSSSPKGTAGKKSEGTAPAN